ncbi:MAG: hypothetical protein HKP14_10790 [Bacteroidia bacterium]|nr:hypothetical protein [Bacteroidia bacterium]
MKLILSTVMLCLTLLVAANNPIKVKVVDENKEPLIGVKLIEVQANEVHFTDFDGEGKLKVENQTKTFLVEFIGYETGYIKVSPNTAQEEIKITLKKK